MALVLFMEPYVCFSFSSVWHENSSQSEISQRFTTVSSSGVLCENEGGFRRVNRTT